MLVRERDADWISDEAVAILDQIGWFWGFDGSWWRESERADERRMTRLVREVLDDVDRTGRAGQWG